MLSTIFQKDYREVFNKTLEQYSPTPFYRMYMRFLNGKGGIPDFFVLGAQKGGTTTLYHMLVKLPSIVPSVRKEIEYLNDPNRRGLGLNWYCEHFPSLEKKEKIARKTGIRPVTGEATTLLNHPLAPELLKAIAPNIRFVVLLREPSSRAFSHYQHNILVGSENRSFEQALEEEDDAVNYDMEKLKEDPNYPAHSLRAHSYKQRGRYVENLTRWFEHFPRQHFYIEGSRRFFNEQDDVLEEIQKFLGLSPFPVKQDKRVYNKGVYSQKMADETKNKLKDYFQKYNEALFKLLGRSLDW